VQSSTKKISIAVASNFFLPLQKISNTFEKETHIKIDLISGSSGKLFSQIINDAPFDLFFSADQEKPTEIEKAGKGLFGSQKTYALGLLVFYCPDNTSLIDSLKKSSHPLDKKAITTILQKQITGKIALANPKLAPYGLAALETLHSLDLYDFLKDKFVQGENIAQTYQFVFSGNAPCGFVAKSQMKLEEAEEKKFWPVPETFYNPIKQDLIVLKLKLKEKEKENLIQNFSQKEQIILQFIQYLQTEKIKQIILSHGYKIP